MQRFVAVRRAGGLFTLACTFLTVGAVAQVTITGTGAGAFKCTEGADPAIGATGTDYLWCDSSHWLTMNNNNSSAVPNNIQPGTSTTSVAGIVDTKDDNTIYSSPVDATNGYPSFLTVPSAGKITLTAGDGNSGDPAPLILYIAGRKEIVTSVLNNTILSASTTYYIYLNFNTIPANTDIAATTLAPVYSRAKPSCSSTTTPQFWFDATTRLMRSCVSSLNNWVAMPVLFLGVIVTNSSNLAAGIGHEPWGLDPFTRMREFGNGGAGATSPATSNTCDGWLQYSAVELTNSGSLTHTQISPNSSKVGCYAYSQNPVVITGTSTVDLKGLGRAGGGAVSGAGSGNGGNAGGFGGSAGGGGGSSSNAGGAGGGHSIPQAYTTSGGGGAGTSGSGNGSNATAQNTSNFVKFNCDQFPPLGGSGGGSGGGVTGGGGGKGGDAGGGLCLKAPSITINTSGTFDADGGGTSGTGACTSPTGNNGQPGAAGGGTIFFDAYVTNITSTITEAAGGNCTGGTGGTGGTGQPGIQVTLQRQ